MFRHTMRRNILFKIFEIFFLCMIAGFPTSNSLPLHHCITDSDCNQPNFYCYESRECVECTNCSSYNRQPSPNTTCAKNKDQCGNCNSGTEAEYTFYGTFTCQPIFTSITKKIDQNSITNDENKHLGLYISIPLSILAVIACVALLIKYKIWLVFKRFYPLNSLNCDSVHLNNNIPTNPPPPYSEKSPSAPPEEDPLITRLRISHDDNQCANPFHPPNYVNGGSCSDSTYHPPNNSETPTAIDDENTQPSGWSPAPQNSSDLNNRPTSFLNILSTVNPQEQEYFEQPPNHEHSNSESSSRNSPYIIVNINTSNMNNTQVINEI